MADKPENPSAVDVLRGARAQLSELIGRPAESVSSFERADHGWQLRIEVLELARVPDTMSLLASYEVELDPRGELTGYRRLRRYERGRADKNG
ncbi:gas vesicle protein [Streptomyces sp. NBC_00212]|uniref:gas vesicle protein GvpO n=1 Tax=Streptomyces sp. NBC_00212 TaxID=2975684 RepID=UPI00324BCBC4